MRLRVPGLSLLLCVIVTPPRRCDAQDDPVRVDLQAGSAWLRQHGIPEAIAGATGMTISQETDRSALSAIVLGACGGTASCTMQGVASAAWFAPAGSPWRWDVELTGSDLAYDRAGPTTSGLAMAREYVGDDAHSLYAGAGLGAVHGPVTQGLALGELGGSWLAGGSRWSLDVRAMRVPTTAQLDSVARGFGGLRTPTFADVGAGWSREVRDGRIAMTVTGGWRTLLAGSGAPSGAWAAAAVTTWLTPQLALVVAGGRALEDLTRGAPESRYVSVSLRARLHGFASWAPRRSFPATVPVATAAALDTATKEIRVRIAGASKVELMADFTGWAPQTLRHDGSVWAFVGPLSPGPHRIAVRIDGGPWRVPANLPTVHDEFGGAFGLITVP